MKQYLEGLLQTYTWALIINQTSIITYSINAQSLTFGNIKKSLNIILYCTYLYCNSTTYFLRKQRYPKSSKNKKMVAIPYIRKVLSYIYRPHNITTNPSQVGIIVDCTLNKLQGSCQPILFEELQWRHDDRTM